MMTFDIDQAKVQQLIDTGAEAYSITTDLKFTIPSTTVYSVDFTPPAEMIDPERYISELRQRVLASGISLASPADIDREIGAMRHRDS